MRNGVFSTFTIVLSVVVPQLERNTGKRRKIAIIFRIKIRAVIRGYILILEVL